MWKVALKESFGCLGREIQRSYCSRALFHFLPPSSLSFSMTLTLKRGGGEKQAQNPTASYVTYTYIYTFRSIGWKGGNTTVLKERDIDREIEREWRARQPHPFPSLSFFFISYFLPLSLQKSGTDRLSLSLTIPSPLSLHH